MAGKLDNYTIVIDGDNKKFELAAKNTVRDLARLKNAANDTNGGVSKLATGVRNASSNVAAFQGPLGGVSGRLGALATMLTNINPAMVGLGLAVSGVTLFMVSAIKEHDQFNLRNKKTAALLRATGSASGFTAHQLDVMAKALALNTLASVEGIKDTQNVLLTFKGVSKDVFSSAMALSQDMAAVMGTDSKSAALQLGKALESPTQGISALKKAGVSFSKAQRDMIRDMENAGRVVDAQSYILETLKNQIGGAGAAAASGTVIGAIDTLSQHWQQLEINVADSSGAANAARSFFEVLADGLASVNEEFWPDEDRRMQELVSKRRQLQDELGSLSQGERTGFLSYLVGPESEWYNVQRSLNEVTQEMAGIQTRRKQQILEEQAASKAAAANDAARQKELVAAKAAGDAKELARIHAKGATAVAAMQMQFASEDEKAVLHLQNNLARIEAWQLSEQEIKARGFATMDELQQVYRDLAYEKLDADLLKIEQRHEQSESRKADQQIAANKKKAEAEKLARAKGMAALQVAEGQFFNILEQSGGKKTQLYKAAFAAQKAAAIPGMIASTEQGATAALALGPVAGPIAATAVRTMGYASVGLVAGQSIAGAFEDGGIVGGSSYTGDKLTAFVNSGEMILNASQQKKLFDVANGMAGGGASRGATEVNIYGAPSGTYVEKNDDGGREITDVFLKDMQQDGEMSQSIQYKFGVSRLGG
ncbi:MAG: hypothetical protein RPT11_02890 [Bermanella sp.]